MADLSTITGAARHVAAAAQRAARAGRDAWDDRLTWAEFTAAVDQARADRDRWRCGDLPGLSNDDIDALPEPELPGE